MDDYKLRDRRAPDVQRATAAESSRRLAGQTTWYGLLLVAVMATLAALATLLLLPDLIAQRSLPDVARGPATAEAPRLPTEHATRHADFGATNASDDARQLADWVAATGDNAGKAFFVVDKKHARLFVFEDSARLRESTPVLLGAALGDDTVPGIGSRPIAEVRPEERTTPAGRFVGERGHNAAGKDVVWVDYDAAVSMHRVVTAQPQERRLERMASPSVNDKRISYGCINVPADFFDAHVRPAFATQRAVIYVLPEQKTLQQVFGLPQRATALDDTPTSMAVDLPGAPRPT